MIRRQSKKTLTVEELLQLADDLRAMHKRVIAAGVSAFSLELVAADVERALGALVADSFRS